MSWDLRFKNLFHRCFTDHKSGNFSYKTGYTSEDLDFLISIGYKPREFFDFVEDLADSEEPSFETALLIAAARRDYFLTIQQGQHSTFEASREELPTFGDELEGIPYLPRILKKARLKLRGELDPDIMFCCGGDRRFLKQYGNIHPADFLRLVWSAGEDDAKVATYVREHL